MIALLLAAALSVGDEAPLFTAALHNGPNTVSLNEWLESGDTKAILVTFFATWCKPCKKEMPLLQKLSQDYKTVKVVSVAIDKDEALWPQIVELAKANQVTYPIVKDRYNLIARQYLGNESNLPAVFLINSEGKIAFAKQGYPDEAITSLRAELDKLLVLPAR